jgi:hypothetical protein
MLIVSDDSGNAWPGSLPMTLPKLARMVNANRRFARQLFAMAWLAMIGSDNPTGLHATDIM